MIKRLACLAVAAASFAFPATALATQPVTIARQADGALLLSVPPAWTIVGCYGTMYTTQGDFNLGIASSPAPNEEYLFNPAGLIGGSLTEVDASCTLSQTQIVWTPQTSSHTIGVDAAYYSTRRRFGSCGWKGFTWGAYHALQTGCWGGAKAWATTTWRLTLPAGAFNVTDSSYGAPVCCGAGSVSHTWHANSDGSYTYTVHTTHQRAYNLAYAALRYEITQQVPVLQYHSDSGSTVWTP